MNRHLDELVARQRQQDLLREAERDRLAALAVARPPRRRGTRSRLAGMFASPSARLRSWLARRLLDRAIARAYRQFARRHPRWAESLFDEYFLTHAAAPLLSYPRRPTPAELARAWAAQFALPPVSWPNGSPDEAVLVAADFLCYLDDELDRIAIGWPVAQPPGEALAAALDTDCTA
jgi:hypothetical protein